MDFDVENLIKLGADERTIEIAKEAYSQGFIPARIIRQYSSLYEVALTPQSSKIAVLTGSFKKKLKDTLEIPVVGDWVLLKDKKTDKLPIYSTIPRKSLISRTYRYKGNQPISANIDAVFFTFSLDPLNFSIETIKHYLNLNLTGNIERYIILNKLDLANKDINAIIATLTKELSIQPTSIIPLDSVNLIGYDILKSKLLPYQTSTFIGPSGVGKSTIINNLYGKKILKTSQVNKRYKGRHTTTNRLIIILSNGHIVIDTPGISFVDISKRYLERFKEIFEYSINCRFSDCLHLTEPGCYIKEMVEKGKINKELYTEYLNFIKSYEKI